MAADGTVTGDLKLEFTPLEFETKLVLILLKVNLKIRIYSVGV